MQISSVMCQVNLLVGSSCFFLF
uniref:Uncharacterized protein n=1 Tax=Anguilla anguilla TaxID=7936 RepID=A0A0E9PQJ7_ANGAN